MNVSTFPSALTKTARLEILVVEAGSDRNAGGDNRNLTDLVRRRFAGLARLRHAGSAESALEHLRSKNFHVVLIDAGLAANEAPLILHRTSEIPRDAAVAVVDWDERARGDQWIQRGADDFIIAHELSQQRIEALLAKAQRTRRLRRENMHMRQQLRHAGREFEHFMRALSHDMMANFMLLESSFSQLQSTLDVESNAASAHMIAHMDACFAESKRFLDDLVQLAKTGSVEMEPQNVALKAIVDEVLFEQSELIDRGGIKVDVAPRLPDVWCNRQRVKQVVTNLVRNAIKHGCDPAQPKMSISARLTPETAGTSGVEDMERGTEHATVLLRVHDNGAGIEARMHDEIFLPGKRLPSASEEGSGMGLAIVRKIAEHYGGSAWVDRQAVTGTGIIVSLPAAPHEAMISLSSEGGKAYEGPVNEKSTQDKTPAALHRPHQHIKARH